MYGLGILTRQNHPYILTALGRNASSAEIRGIATGVMLLGDAITRGTVPWRRAELRPPYSIISQSGKLALSEVLYKCNGKCPYNSLVILNETI